VLNKTTTLLLGALGALALAGSAGAQTAGATGGTMVTTTTTTSTAGAYDRLSPGNRSIVDALYQSQTQPATMTTTTTGTGTGTTTTVVAKAPLTRDQIAAMGPGAGGEGWGRVFQEMKAGGYTDAKNLGEVVSSYHHEINDAKTGTSTTDSTAINSTRTTGQHSGRYVRDNEVAITTAGGATDVVGHGSHGGDRGADTTVSARGGSSNSHGGANGGGRGVISGSGGNGGGNSGSHGQGKH
jgi:hypothetical protein